MVCPVCTVAVGAGVGILRGYGVDDVLSGIWFGALIVSSIAWMIDYLNRKNIHFIFKPQLVIVLFYALFIWPLYVMGIMGNPQNIILGMDRILFGVLIGTIIFILGVLANIYMKKINDGKVMVNYQKIIIPVVFLTIATIITHLLIKIYNL